ncbi:MAG: TolC family protein [Gemmatimonadota bacterium]|nr:TolC family protein [Gemmatimonadota bacterium]
MITHRIAASARSAAAALLVLLAVSPAGAQRAVTRGEAERAALSAGSRIALARADTAAAMARLLSARALPNPTLAASYSRATPQKHVTLDVPLLDAFWTRGLRVNQASASARAARLLYATERVAALVEVDTTYTRALAADARFRLSRQTARDADSLRKMTVARRDAGDASDLDVDLATVVSGQQLNLTTGDSLSYMSALLTVQTLMGLPADSVAIVLSDSLVLAPPDTLSIRQSLDSGAVIILVPPSVGTSSVTLPPSTPTSARVGTASSPGNSQAAAGSLTGATTATTAGASQSTGTATTPGVAAAQANLQATELGVALQQRSVFVLPSISIGVEFGDPSGSEPGYLPLIGLSVPLPLFNRNQGPIAEARAERDRAIAQLSAARLESRQRLIESVREREQLIARIARDRDLVVRAQRVADRSLTAYREGAAALPAVLEARRSAREVLGQYIDDLAALLTVNTELRALTQNAPVP